MYRKKTKLWLVILITGLLVAGAALSLQQQTFAAWKENDKGKMYENEEGISVTGFFEIEGNLYHFSKEGYLETGKFYDEGKEAYYYANKDGVIQTGIIKTKKVFYITDEEGRIQTGFQEYNGNRYYFKSNADMAVGWFKDGDNWYYADDSGVVMTGFLELEGYRYYLDNNGVRISDTVMEIDGIYYVFNSDGSIDENATLLYGVYQYIIQKRSEQGGLKEISQNSKVQACAIMRASKLKEGYGVTSDENSSIETLLQNRGVMCQGGYEFSYGGVPGYDVEKLLLNLEQDANMKTVLKNPDIKELGLGVHKEDDIYYFDFIFIK
ncbi:MAG: hypothetical protein K2I10_11520 [Lachnospiraceae bacterium]|nr:hypothetical protein [Lachnospiraceae bacterium]